jgi:ketosteroid isomerase-like protein
MGLDRFSILNIFGSKPMKKFIFFPLAISLIFSSCQQTAEQELPDYTKMEEEAKELLEYSMDLFKAKDLDGLVNRFTKDGSLKLPNAPLIEGHEALRENYSGTLNLENFSIQLDPIRTIVAESGDMAWLLASFSVAFDTPGGPFADKGISLLVLHRIGDEWKIAAENLSSGPGPG